LNQSKKSFYFVIIF